MTFAELDILYDKYHNSKGIKNKKLFNYYLWLAEEYFMTKEKLTNLPLIIDEGRLSMEKLDQNLVIHELNLLLKIILDDSFNFCFRQIIDVNNTSESIRTISMYHPNSIKVEKFLYELYELNSNNYHETLLILQGTINSRRFWYHCMDESGSLNFERVDSVKYLKNLRITLDRAIASIGQRHITKTVNGIRMEHILMEYFDLPFHEKKFAALEIIEFASLLSEDPDDTKKVKSCKDIIDYLGQKKPKFYFQRYLFELNDTEKHAKGPRIVESSNKKKFIDNVYHVMSNACKSGYSISSIKSYFYNSDEKISFESNSEISSNELKNLKSKLNYIENTSFFEKIYSIYLS